MQTVQIAVINVNNALKSRVKSSRFRIKITLEIEQIRIGNNMYVNI